ncbi:MAG: Na+:solute symporter, partial [Planctomycetes bacterium]|nr:Na+:solute symporter [Planctomycetota bacterium]
TCTLRSETFLPHGLLGLVVGSLIAAYMSTISTHLNWGSSYVVNDFWKRFVNKEASEKELVRVGRISTVLMMLVAAALALWLENALQAFHILLQIGAGTGLLFILRWFWWRINAWSELSAMLASALISSLLYVLKLYVWNEQLGWLSDQGILAITVAGSTVTWLTVTFMTAPVEEEKLRTFYRKVRPYGAWRRIASQSGVTPAKGLGRMLVNWLAGSAMVLAGTFSIGKFLLGAPRQGWLYLAVTVAGAAVIWREVGRPSDRHQRQGTCQR